ncbi:MAG: hypothetical protein AB7Y46_04415 [Armatimonadota bacterium]
MSGPEGNGRLTPHRGTWALLAVAILGAGFAALMLQVVLTRELIVSFVGNELTVSVILLGWLLLVAAGSALAGRLAPARATPGLMAGLGVALAPLMGLSLGLARLAGQQGDFPGQLASPLTALILTFASLAPACVVLGAQFAVGCALFERAGAGGAARVYVLEATGAVAAGVLFHFVVADHLSAVVAVAALGALSAGIAALLARSAGARALAAAGCAVVLCALAPAIAPGAARAIDGRLLELRWSRNLVAWTNTRYGMWSVSRQADQLTFAHDGLPMFATGPAAEPEAIHLALAAHAAPREVLLIGGGPPTVREALTHPLRRLDYVELDRGGLEFVRAHAPPALVGALSDPRVRLRFTDGRAFVKGTSSAYDVIAVHLPDPTTAVLNRYYTAQFFAQAARALRPDGLLMVGLASPRIMLTGERRLTIGGVWRALGAAFAQRQVLPVGETLYLLAFRDPSTAPVTPEELGRRLTQRGVAPQFLTPFTLGADLNPLALDLARATLERAGDAPPNTDLRPVAYHLQMRLWIRQFAPRAQLGWLDALTPRRVGLGAWAAVGLTLLAAAGLGRRGGYRGYALGGAVALIGLLEMGVQLAVIFAFQSIAGYLYHQIGLLMTLNMLGLALGAWGARRLRSERAAAGFVGLCALFSGLCAAMPWLMRAASEPALTTPVLGGVALAASLLTGAAFPLGVALSPGAGARAGPSLWALDLVGGALGAAAIGIVLVPVIGLDAATRTLAILGVAALAACLPLLRGRGADGVPMP